MTAVRASLMSEFQGTVRRSTRRLPIALGLGIAGLLSVALWTGVIMACLRIF